MTEGLNRPTTNSTSVRELKPSPRFHLGPGDGGDVGAAGNRPLTCFVLFSSCVQDSFLSLSSPVASFLNVGDEGVLLLSTCIQGNYRF
jgi:hypothetical protein